MTLRVVSHHDDLRLVVVRGPFGDERRADLTERDVRVVVHDALDVRTRLHIQRGMQGISHDTFCSSMALAAYAVCSHMM